MLSEFWATTGSGWILIMAFWYGAMGLAVGFCLGYRRGQKDRYPPNRMDGCMTALYTCWRGHCWKLPYYDHQTPAQSVCPKCGEISSFEFVLDETLPPKLTVIQGGKHD